MRRAGEVCVLDVVLFVQVVSLTTKCVLRGKTRVSLCTISCSKILISPIFSDRRLRHRSKLIFDKHFSTLTELQMTY